MKQRGEKIAVLTAYDYPTARLLDEGGVDVLLVGDSLGMVVLGYPDTTHVTMDEMLHHTRAVARGAQRAPILADLPYRQLRHARKGGGKCAAPDRGRRARRETRRRLARISPDRGARREPAFPSWRTSA